MFILHMMVWYFLSYALDIISLSLSVCLLHDLSRTSTLLSTTHLFFSGSGQRNTARFQTQLIYLLFIFRWGRIHNFLKSNLW